MGRRIIDDRIYTSKKRYMDNLAGKRFGMLLVIELTNTRNDKNQLLWLCKCDCGNEKTFISGRLKHGGNKSCGCLRSLDLENKRLKSIWWNMIGRCYHKNNISYKYYGAKGIIVCYEWKSNYSEFKNWALKNGYQSNLTIDRFPNRTGNYEPGNCRWATYKEQENNKTNNRYLKIDGEIKTISQWSEVFGIDKSTIYKRVKIGWDVELAVKTKTKKYNYGP